MDRFIDEDIGNNSAWNYRYFLLKAKGVNMEAELKYIYGRIGEKPNNEAVWNYLRG